MRRYMCKIILVFVFSALGVGTHFAHAEAPLCSSIFFDSNISDSNKLNDYLNNQLREKSRILQNEFRQKPPHYEFVVIGTGVHASIFNNEVGRSGHASQVLAIEAGSTVAKVYDGSFLLNTNRKDFSKTNFFRGSPLSVDEISGEENFQDSIHLGLIGTATQIISNIPVLLENPVTSVEDTTLTGRPAPGRYIVTTKKGLTVYADNIVVATGQGDIDATKIQGLSFQKLWQQSSEQQLTEPRKIQKFMTSDTIRSLVSSGAENIAELKNKTILMVGKGDGASSAMEALLQKIDSSVKIIWIGQAATTSEEFMGGKGDRYKAIADQMGKQIRGGFPEHATDARLTIDGKIELSYGLQNEKIEGDYLVVATGYQETYSQLFKNLNGSTNVPSFSLQEIRKNNENSSGITKRLHSPALPEQNIFLIGAAHGGFLTLEEIQAGRTKPKVSIKSLSESDILAAQFLFKSLPAEEKIGLLSSPEWVSNEVLLKPTSLNLGLSAKGLQNLIKIKFVQFLQARVSAPIPPLALLVEKNGDTSSRISLGGIQKDQAQRILNEISSSPEFTNLLAEFLKSQNSLRLDWKTL